MRTSSHAAIHAWLLLLPALVLLVAFTHWPAVATFIDSFHTTPKGGRAGVWVGLENYQAMAEGYLNEIDRMQTEIREYLSRLPEPVEAA